MADLLDRQDVLDLSAGQHALLDEQLTDLVPFTRTLLTGGIGRNGESLKGMGGQRSEKSGLSLRCGGSATLSSTSRIVLAMRPSGSSWRCRCHYARPAGWRRFMSSGATLAAIERTRVTQEHDRKGLEHASAENFPLGHDTAPPGRSARCCSGRGDPAAKR